MSSCATRYTIPYPQVGFNTYREGEEKGQMMSSNEDRLVQNFVLWLYYWPEFRNSIKVSNVEPDNTPNVTTFHQTLLSLFSVLDRLSNSGESTEGSPAVELKNEMDMELATLNYLFAFANLQAPTSLWSVYFLVGHNRELSKLILLLLQV
jgi:hypothetical protein